MEQYGITRNNEILRYVIDDEFFPDNPLNDGFYKGHLAIQHGNWDCGCSSPDDEIDHLLQNESIDPEDVPTFQSFADALQARGYFIRPIYIYEHGSIKLSLCPLLAELEKTVNAVDAYVNGNVYDISVDRLDNPCMMLNTSDLDWYNIGYEAECLGDLYDLQQKLEKKLEKYYGIRESFDTLEQAANAYLEKTGEKAFTVSITRTITEDVVVLANGQEEAEKLAHANI